MRSVCSCKCSLFTVRRVPEEEKARRRQEAEEKKQKAHLRQDIVRVRFCFSISAGSIPARGCQLCHPIEI